MQGYFPLLRYSPTLRFTVFGAMSYTVFSVIGVLISLRSVASYVNFTQVSIAYSHLGLYAFLGIGLRDRTNDAHAARRRFSARREFGKPSAAVQRKHRNSFAISSWTQ